MQAIENMNRSVAREENGLAQSLKKTCGIHRLSPIQTFLFGTDEIHKRRRLGCWGHVNNFLS